MPLLLQDYETRSEVDLRRCGLDRYANDQSTLPLMLAWSFAEDLDDLATKAPIELWQPHLGPMPVELREDLEDPFVTKVSWNSAFERYIHRLKLGLVIPPYEWLDPMIWARHLSMPGKLDQVSKILELGAEGKLKEVGDIPELGVNESKKLKTFFCEPAIPPRNLPLFGQQAAFFHDWQTDPEKWAQFCLYCINDVKALRAALHKMRKFPLPDFEQGLWCLDQQINDHGIPMDLKLIEGGSKVAELAKAELQGKMEGLTGVANTNSRDQLLPFLQAHGYPFSSIGKAFISRALAGEGDLDDLGRQVLELRQQAAKTSSVKLLTMHDQVGADGRLRHQLAFMGAGRTGRWSAKGSGGDSVGIQAQNFARPTKEVEKKYEKAVKLLQAGDFPAIKKAFSSPIDVVGSCVRAAIAAPPGSHLDVCDLASIEPRVLAWIAGDVRVLNDFRAGKDPYIEFAAGFYKKNSTDVTKAERQVAKPAVLGCGYQLSGGEEVTNEDGDLYRSGLWGYSQAMQVEMTREEAHKAVRFYRATHKEVVDLWYALDRAAITAIRTCKPQTLGKVTFQCFGDKILRVMLPSGRGLHYIRPKIETKTFEDRRTGESRTRDSVSYEGVDGKTRQWVRMDTFGGHWVENIVQAIARDVLAFGMVTAAQAGFQVVTSAHDELVCETPDNSHLTLDNLRESMITSIPWAADLPLDAAGYQSQRYRKD